MMLVLLASPTSASITITTLGKPTNDLPQRPLTLLAGFHKAGPFLRQSRKAEVLFVGAMVQGNGDGTPAVERWALVKALMLFGRFTGLIGVAEPFCTGLPPNPGCQNPDRATGYATPDLDRARYTSPYVNRASRDLIDDQLHVHSDLSTTERQLVQHYILNNVISPTSRWDDLVWRAALEPGENQGLPLISIGGYLRVDAGVAIPGDLTPTVSSIPLSPATVQEALVRGKPTGGAPYSLLHDVNAEVNVLTALICHADGMRPRSVCTRSPIHTILRAMK